MYICPKCKMTFADPATERDDIGYKYSVCPYCWDDRIEEAVVCPVTGELIPKSRDISLSAEIAIRKYLYGILAGLGVVDDAGKRAVLGVIEDWLEDQ